MAVEFRAFDCLLRGKLLLLVENTKKTKMMMKKKCMQCTGRRTDTEVNGHRKEEHTLLLK